MEQTRFLTTQSIANDAINVEERTVKVAFSSEEPAMQWFGREILLHGEDNIQLDRLNSGGAVLVDHDTTDHVGVVKSVELGVDKVARATLKFSNSTRGSEVFQDIVDGIRSHVSVGYFINNYREEGEGEARTFYVDSWQPYEISFVSVPADYKQAGVGRNVNVKGENMTDKNDQQKAEPVVEANKVDLEAQRKMIQAEAEKIASERVAMNESFRSQAEQFGKQDLAKQAIQENWTESRFQKELLGELSKKGSFEVPSAPEVGLSERESKEFSFTRLINAMANPSSRRAQEAAAFEFEACDAAAKKHQRDARGAMIPYEVLLSGQRDVLVDKGGASNAGHNLVATQFLAGSFIDLLYSKMPLIRQGHAKVMSGLVGEIAIPKFVSGSSTYWVGENANVTESGATFGQVSMTPHTIGAAVDLSRRLLIQSTPDAERIIRDNMARQMGLGIHNAMINGTGTNDQPTGLINTSGLGVVAIGANGGAITRDALIELETEIAVDDAEDGSMIYLTNPKVLGALKKIKVDAGSGMFLYDHLSYPIHATNQVPSNLDKGTSTGVCSALIMGAFKENLMLGLWSGLDLIVDTSTGSLAGTTRLVMHQDVDVAVRDIKHFQSILDITT